MKHNPNEWWSLQKILKVFIESIDRLPLTVSQTTAMEFDDRNIVQGYLKLLNSSVLLNHGTNACAFLAIGILDNCSKFNCSIFDPNILTNEITRTITGKFNLYRPAVECLTVCFYHVACTFQTGWVFVYEQSGSGFESRCCHLNFSNVLVPTKFT